MWVAIPVPRHTPEPSLPVIRHVIVTGADGYIGDRLVALAREQGWRVTTLSRRPGPDPRAAVRRVAWALGDPLPPAALDPALPPAAQALIHLAHDWTNQGAGAPEGGLNLAGAEALLASTRTAGLGRFVFVSSQSARQDAANIYGRVKWNIEQRLSGGAEVAARVGLVYGGPQAAMFGLLSRITRLAPVLPMIDPWREVQPIHRDEVCNGLLRLADPVQHAASGWVGLAGPVGIPFGTFLRTLAREFHGKSLPIVPVPLRLALLACDVSKAIPFGPTVDRERVLGLAGTQPMPCASHLEAIGLEVLPLAEGLRREPGARKALLREAHALLAYVLRSTPGRALTRRYARAASQGGALALPGFIHLAPTTLRLIEPVRRPGHPPGPLGDRLALATALAEASPDGERALAARSRAGRLAALAADLVLDVAAFPIRLLVGLRRR